jgi:hypothetical protein
MELQPSSRIIQMIESLDNELKDIQTLSINGCHSHFNSNYRRLEIGMFRLKSMHLFAPDHKKDINALYVKYLRTCNQLFGLYPIGDIE